MAESLYIMGIDPGEHGGIALIDSGGRCLETLALNRYGLHDLWNWIGNCTRTTVLLERPPKYTGIPRPASRIAPLFRSYGQLEMALAGNTMNYHRVDPETWQSGLCIFPRKKGKKKGKGVKEETYAQWKKRLKETAEEIFPQTKVTLAVADALLIAEYGRRKLEGLIS